MALRIPPGRGGRLWLERRLEIARRGAEVLDRRRRALLRLERGLADEVEASREEWEREAREAAVWLARAATLAGARPLRLAVLHTPAPVAARVEWQRTLGVVYPAGCTLGPAPQTDTGALGGSAAVAVAATAHRRALVAAARHAVARTAHELVTSELAAVAVRARAIERRWLPLHQQALTALELQLDETDREEAVRARRIRRRGHA